MGLRSPRVTVLVVLSIIPRVRLQIYEIRTCAGGKGADRCGRPGDIRCS